MAITTPPSIDTPPALPDRSIRATFATLAQAWVAWEKISFPQVSAVCAWIYNTALEVFGLANTATASAAVAVASANFKGNWSSLTGPLNMPATVRHAGQYWALLQNLADVTTQTPVGGSAYWAATGAIGGQATVGLDLLKGPDIASAATLSGIWTSTQGNVMTVTGTTATSSFGTASQAGASRTLIAAGAWPLTNGANLIIDGGQDYVCAPGDRVIVLALTTTQFRVFVAKADGTPISGIVLLTPAAGSGASAVDFTSKIDGKFNRYLFDVIQWIPSAASVAQMQTSSNFGVSFDSGASDYSSAGNETAPSPVNAPFGAANSSAIALSGTNVSGTAADGGANILVSLQSPSSTGASKLVEWHGGIATPGPSWYSVTGAGVRKATAAINAVRFKPSTGTVTFKINMYGVK
jgi:hypothetical protein